MHAFMGKGREFASIGKGSQTQARSFQDSSKRTLKEHFLATVRDAADHIVARWSNFVQSEVPIWEISSSLILFAH